MAHIPDLEEQIGIVDAIVGDWPEVRPHVCDSTPPVASFYFGRGWCRDFALLRDASLWLRSDDAPSSAAARQHPSTNWWIVPWQALDDLPLAELLQESYQLCQLRNAGFISDHPLDEANVLLAAGLRAAEQAAWPAPPWHLGGPKATCPPERKHRILDWCVSLLEAADLAVLDDKRRTRAEAFVRGEDDSVADAIRLIVRAHADDLATTRSFLEELDRQILIGELGQKLAKQLPKEQAAKIREVLWRVADDKGRLVGWIARLEDEQLGLLAKLGRKWSWVKGDRDSILATVPDAYFESAARAIG